MTAEAISSTPGGATAHRPVLKSVQEVQAALAVIDAGDDELSKHARRQKELARGALQEASAANGIKAECKLSEAVGCVVAAVQGCTPDFVKKVHDALGAIGRPYTG